MPFIAPLMKNVTENLTIELLNSCSNEQLSCFNEQLCSAPTASDKPVIITTT